MFKSKYFLFFSLFLLSFLTYSQTIKVKKETARIKSEYADGFEVELQATSEEAEDALTKLMKSFGKTKQGDDYVFVAEPIVNGTTYVAPVYARVKQLGNIVSAWVGIRTKEWDASV